jgi:D-alanyl-D-alanine carboxypeptidase
MIQANKNYFFIFIVLFVLLEGVIFNIHNIKLENDYKENEQRVQKIEVDLNNTNILAKAYSVYDITIDRKIYGKNDDVVMPLASLAKIMSVVVALDNKVESIYISKNAIKQEGDFGIFENEKWKISDLAKLTLVCSANDGAYAMVENDKEY